MITLTQGDLLRAPVDALVNAVNIRGVMGKGIALQFKQTYPAMFQQYAADCAAGFVAIGKMHIVSIGAAGERPRWIVNFPTKRHWTDKSRFADVEAGLVDLVAQIRRLQIRSIAIPALGCGLGGLAWKDVHPVIVEALSVLPEVDVQLFAPGKA